MEKKTNHNTEWNEYVKHEMATLSPILADLGFVLNDEQPHTLGERFLQQAVTTTHGRKIILIGRRKNDGLRVVIKATRDRNGAREIEHERVCRSALRKIGFAYQVFHSPEEILFTKEGGFSIFVQKFLDTKPFLERPIKEQFVLSLGAFMAQEGAHATTYRHHRFIEKTFGGKSAADYLHAFDTFKTYVGATLFDNKTLLDLFQKAEQFLKDNERTIEQYGDFLTHIDFVPHNFRVEGDTIYLLDHSSIRFGNKHEGWARFINFMDLYNPPLAEALVQYVKDNRAPEELLSLKLMRVYRLGEIICYYARTLERSEGDLLTLNEERVALWSAVLSYVLADSPVPRSLIETYKVKRDALRSPYEKKRQVGLH